MANTKRIQTAKVKKLWNFPPLSDGKQGRVVTKHFTNLSYVLNPNHYAILNYLIYQSSADNTIEYSEKLLTTFRKAVRMALNEYGGDLALHLSLPKLRESFEWLVENGLLLPTATPKRFLINPCLTFSKVYVKSEFYKEWMRMYEQIQFIGDFRGNQENRITDSANSYIEHVENNFKRRGKRL